MRGIAAAAALVGGLGGLGGCLKSPGYTYCPETGAECPASLLCLPAPIYCGTSDQQQQLLQCDDKPDLTLCSTDAIPSGVCLSQSCTACTPDYGTCPVSGWQPMSQMIGTTPSTIWVTSATDAYMAGNGPTIAHYDGLSWTQDATYAAMFPSALPLRLWVSPDGALYVIDNSGSANTLERYANGSWSTVSPGGIGLDAIWGTSANDIIVGGFRELLRYNGSTWTSVGPLSMDLSATAEFTAVWYSGDQIVAVGGGGLFWQYDGATWTDVGTPLPVPYNTASWSAVWGTSPSDVFAVSASNGSPLSTIAVHYNETTGWTPLSTPNGLTLDLVAVTGVGPSDAYVVGNSKGGTATGVILHCDAQACTSVDELDSVKLAGVSSAASATDTMAVAQAAAAAEVFRSTDM